MPSDKLLIERACSEIDVKRRLPNLGETVRVNMNLNRGLLSVKGASGDNRGRVLCYTAAPVCLEDVEFRVRDAVYEKIQNEGARDVCAYAQGTLRPYNREGDRVTTRSIFYNPMRQKHFHLEGGTAVQSADVLRAWVEERAEKRNKARMQVTGPTDHEQA